MRRCRSSAASPRAEPLRCAIDLAIAATANLHRVLPITLEAEDFRIIGDLVEVREP